jgi:FMN phosphatase YigB (HAD superfamily)
MENKTDYSRCRALLIDIDDTIVRFKRRMEGGTLVTIDGRIADTGSLIDVLKMAAVELGSLTLEEASQRIAKVKSEIEWWHWSDFIVALDLPPKKFWQYALETERHYLEATGPEIAEALHRIHDAGILLYVASNNPSSGILHKLNVAGIATVNGSTLFSQLLGGTELHAIKGNPVYWRKALAHIGLDAEEVAVVGDNPHDDYKVPNSIGISHTFLVNRDCDHSENNSSSVTYVRDFSQIASRLLDANLSTSSDDSVNGC